MTGFAANALYLFLRFFPSDSFHMGIIWKLVRSREGVSHRKILTFGTVHATFYTKMTWTP
jgi:hypothetical protein